MDVYLAADRRTPRGVRGLKSFFVRQTRLQDTRRTPRGVRGLKLDRVSKHPRLHLVAPLAGCVG